MSQKRELDDFADVQPRTKRSRHDLASLLHTDAGLLQPDEVERHIEAICTNILNSELVVAVTPPSERRYQILEVEAYLTTPLHGAVSKMDAVRGS